MRSKAFPIVVFITRVDAGGRILSACADDLPARGDLEQNARAAVDRRRTVHPLIPHDDIDLVFFFRQKRIEKDLVVKPDRFKALVRAERGKFSVYVSGVIGFGGAPQTSFFSAYRRSSFFVFV